MSSYSPDKWLLCKVTNTDGRFCYKILATWSGSYTYGSSWKLSSGSESVKVDGDYYVLPQTSGSEYRLHKEMEGVCSGWYSLPDTFEKQALEMGGKFEVIKDPKFEELSFT